ncbi:TetR/AcrR family transcriptional regulator [Mycobacterium sp. M1]|uniref:TetR/AcrR family transcriptional regulator n=1 Tax=Mycolicibacter acidiphilus TaxID=2835306 RepID=A0ABS5RIG6_9MYCO|nr:TetR/AcrR family transcriptional regulator [Mycolicibacter acidiphilus]MBS9534092.1 TetR/AcrR family transcriptional regulator [Mycolicibacter acidiphilus]
MAALRLLAERGYDDFTVEVVAARVGVNKTTIYRWWPSKEALLGAALLDSEALYFDMPDTGSLRGDLLALAEHVAGLLVANTAVVTAIFGAAQRKPQLAELLHDFSADRLARERPIFERAVQRGELPPDVDPKTVMDLLDGAIWFRVLVRGEQIPPGFLAAIVDAILAGSTCR